jgi:thiamine transport system substrate-binding protein
MKQLRSNRPSRTSSSIADQRTPARAHRGVVMLATIASLTFVAGCTSGSTSGSDESATESAAESVPAEGQRVVRVVSYDSFTPTKEVIERFTAETGIAIEILPKGDTGTMLNTSIIAKDEPFADVIWGIDSTFLSRAASSGLLKPHGIAAPPTQPSLQPSVGADLVVPVDTSEVCVNADTAKLPGSQAFGFESLIDPANKGTFVVQNPASSAPGLAFLLATISKFGETGWREYWEALRRNDVKVVNGWDEAWNTEFSGAGAGARPLVVSYSNSPVASVLFGADPSATTSPIAVLKDTCIDVVEYAGLIANTDNPDASAVLQFFLSEEFQKELATSLFVYPSREGVELPEIYSRLGIAPVDSSLTIDPARVQAMRDVWIDEWTETVLG